jgi:hypothetical protein
MLFACGLACSPRFLHCFCTVLQLALLGQVPLGQTRSGTACVCCSAHGCVNLRGACCGGPTVTPLRSGPAAGEMRECFLFVKGIG